MLPSCTSLVAICALAALSTAAPVPPEGKQPVYYFPATKGTKWVYEYDGGEMVHIVTAVETRKTDKLVTVGKEEDGEVKTLLTLSVSAKGILQLTKGETDLDETLWLLKVPAKPGDKWQLDHTVGLVRMKGTVSVAKPELVEVPAGKYEAIRLDWEYKLNDAPQLRTYWYAAGVGMVKMKTGTQELRLKSFHPGKE